MVSHCHLWPQGSRLGPGSTLVSRSVLASRQLLELLSTADSWPSCCPAVVAAPAASAAHWHYHLLLMSAEFVTAAEVAPACCHRWTLSQIRCFPPDPKKARALAYVDVSK